MNRINAVAEALGYSESQNYFTGEDLINKDIFNAHWRKVLSIIKPDALYMIGHTPLILFFNKEKGVDFKTIWNAQVPFIFVLKEDTIYVYNGKKWIENEKELEQLEKKH